MNSAMYFLKNEQHQLTKSVEKMLLQKLEEMENNLHTKIRTGNENVTSKISHNSLESKLACFSHSTLISGKHFSYINN